ncbi:hypothetical protein NL108_004364 [Boleophthalmus pectinirostris]|nr:hypothetical protein NL108_004364 [Boleophthalmus pectinirostris]
MKEERKTWSKWFPGWALYLKRKGRPHSPASSETSHSWAHSSGCQSPLPRGSSQSMGTARLTDGFPQETEQGRARRENLQHRMVSKITLQVTKIVQITLEIHKALTQSEVMDERTSEQLKQHTRIDPLRRLVGSIP